MCVCACKYLLSREACLNKQTPACIQTQTHTSLISNCLEISAAAVPTH